MRLVMKFGGTSVKDIARIRAVARRVKTVWNEGHELAVVVSAMAGETDRLAELCGEMSPLFDLREFDVVVSTGEQVVSGLLVMALQNLGVDARSWLGWQLPLITNNAHGNAQVERIDCKALIKRLERKEVAVIPGFQGLDPERNRLTTLGRGGSDTSAVALAVALNADRCDIYTDVDGVYTSDPRMVPKARKLDRVNFEEMLEMASLGAKVLQTRSVSLAARHGMALQVLSSYEDKPGTFVCALEENMEQTLVSAVAADINEARVTLQAVPDEPGVAAMLFSALAEEGINVDMIVQSPSINGKGDRNFTDISFTVGRADVERTRGILEKRENDLGYARLDFDESVVKVSIIGRGMKTNAGVAARMFSTLADKAINISVISTSEIKVSVLIEEEFQELAVRALHSAFGLDGDE